MELAVIIWLICAGLCYIIARDRAPSKTGLAICLGILLGPLGILITFFLNDS